MPTDRASKAMATDGLEPLIPEWVVPTKLSAPPMRSRLVGRPHLLSDLHAAIMSARLTLVSAPAGFGKTTLVQAWHATAAGGAAHLAWLSLDAPDNDPVRFWTGIVAALRRTFADVGERTLAGLRSVQPSAIDGILPSLIRDLDGLGQDLVLVLDEYEVIDNPLVHHGLGVLVEQLPLRAHVLMTTRADPPLPLARFRARGWLAEFRAPMLRFGWDEVATFVRDVMDIPDLSEEDLALLAERTEGWVAGVQLAALSLRDRADGPGRLAQLTSTPRFVVDYLVEDVLDRQADDVRAFLTRTAILDRLCDSLCDAVTETLGSQAMLERLERANLFVSSLDAQRRWYRYHALFAEVLRLRLQQRTPELVPELHRRAAAWFAVAGSPREVVEHSLAAGDWGTAADRIEALHQPLVAGGEHATLQRWIEQLPERVLDAHPYLWAALAWTRLLLGQWSALNPMLATAERSANAQAHRPALAALACVQAGWSILRADGPAAAAAARRTLSFLPPGERFWTQRAVAALGYAELLEGHTTEAAELLIPRHAPEGDGSREKTPFTPSLMYAQGEVHRARGELHQANHVYGEMLRLAGDLPMPARLDALVQQGEVLREWNQLGEAEESLRHALALGARYGHPGNMMSGFIALGRLLMSQGKADESLEALASARMTAESVDSPVFRDVAAAYVARVDLRQGNLATAVAWSENVADGAQNPPTYAREPELLTLVRVWLSSGDTGRAARLLESLLSAAEASERRGSIAEILSLQSHVSRAAGAHDRAMAQLARALAVAEPGGYVRLFADDGPSLMPILADLAAAQRPGRFIPPSAAYVRTLLVLAGWPATRDTHATSSDAVGLVQPLSARELEVLSRMATGAPNEQIATELVIGVTTVKSHVNGIFRKLGAANRLDAVARARAAGLLADLGPRTPR